MSKNPVGLSQCVDEQREVTILAHVRGYFAVPRRTTLNEISRELGISSKEAHVRLSRCLEQLLEQEVHETDTQ